MQLSALDINFGSVLFICAELTLELLSFFIYVNIFGHNDSK